MTKREKIISSLLAVGIFLLLFLGDKAREDTQSFDMVVLGDSLFGHVQDETSIVANLEKNLQKKIFNGALGGTCMGRLEENNGSRMGDALSLVSLTKAILSGDFRIQENQKITGGGTDYFPDTLAGLQKIDFSEVEILLIGHCTNDYHAEEAIYNEADAFDEHTYIGALRSSVKQLQKEYPELRIVLVTAPYTWYTNLGITCEEYVRGGNVLEDYVNAEIAAAEELGIEIIDIYHDLYPHEDWEDWMLYSVDGLHPNEAGRVLLAQVITDYFRNHP